MDKLSGGGVSFSRVGHFYTIREASRKLDPEIQKHAESACLGQIPAAKACGACMRRNKLAEHHERCKKKLPIRTSRRGRGRGFIECARRGRN